MTARPTGPAGPVGGVDQPGREPGLIIGTPAVAAMVIGTNDRPSPMRQACARRQLSTVHRKSLLFNTSQASNGKLGRRWRYAIGFLDNSR
jgi:hypothetical protein